MHSWNVALLAIINFDKIEKEDATKSKHLKGQCHEDFAVLGQFWAKIITLRLNS